MSRYLVIFINPLVFLLSFLIFFYYGRYPIVLLIISILNILFSWHFATKRKFWHDKILVLNLLIAYAAQFIFLILLISGPLRYTLTFVIAFIWGLIWWLIGRHYLVNRQPVAIDYLSALKFFYYINFWFLSVSSYALIVLIQWPWWQAVLVMVVSAGLWSYQIFRWEDEKNRLGPVLIILTLAEILLVLYLLPISFLVAATIATLCLFFLSDKYIGQLHHFLWHLILFLIVIFVLLFTSLI